MLFHSPLVIAMLLGESNVMINKSNRRSNGLERLPSQPTERESHRYLSVKKPEKIFRKNVKISREYEWGKNVQRGFENRSETKNNTK